MTPRHKGRDASTRRGSQLCRKKKRGPQLGDSTAEKISQRKRERRKESSFRASRGERGKRRGGPFFGRERREGFAIALTEDFPPLGRKEEKDRKFARGGEDARINERGKEGGLIIHVFGETRSPSWEKGGGRKRKGLP